ncbi:YtxH domain-containing protein [Fibrella sp. USSR17]
MFFNARKYPQDYLTDNPYLAGLLTGLAAGLSIGLLVAPRSGKELRKQLTDSVNDRTDELKHRWGKVESQGKETIDTARTEVAPTADKVEDKVDELADEAKSGFDRLKDMTRFF